MPVHIELDHLLREALLGRLCQYSRTVALLAHVRRMVGLARVGEAAIAYVRARDSKEIMSTAYAQQKKHDPPNNPSQFTRDMWRDYDKYDLAWIKARRNLREIIRLVPPPVRRENK